MCAKFQVIRTRFDRFFDRKRILRILEFLGLNPWLIQGFDVVLGVLRIGTSLGSSL